MMMEGTIEKDCSAVGGLFQSIISDMRVSMGLQTEAKDCKTQCQLSLID